MTVPFRLRYIILSMTPHNTFNLLEVRQYLTVFVLSTFHSIYNESWNVMKTVSVQFYLCFGNSELQHKINNIGAKFIA